MMVLSILSAVLLVTGVFFTIVGAIGFVRLPDVFCRLHVTGILDTLGAPLILLAVGIHVGPTLASLKLVLGLIFLAVTSPIVAHLLARTALEAGQQPGVIDRSAEFFAYTHRLDAGEAEREEAT